MLSPEELNALSPDAIRGMLHDLRVRLAEIEARSAGGRHRPSAAGERAGEALPASQEVLSLFIRHSPIYAYLKTVTPTESRVVQASDNFIQMIGIAGAAMAGKTMAELFPADLAAKMTAADWSVIARGEVLRWDEDLNGRHYTSIKFPITLDGQHLLAGYTIDITDQKRAQQSLQNSENRYRELIDLAVDGILLGNHDGVIIEANQAICDLFRVEREELIGRHIGELSFKRASLESSPFRFDLLRAGQVVVSERAIVRADSAELVVEMRTKMMPDGTYQSIYRDITGRKRTEAELVAARERYFSFYNVSPVGYFTLNGQGLIQEVNQTSAVLLGVDQAALAGQPLRRFVSGDDRGLYDACRRQLLETGKSQTCDQRMVKADGNVFWVCLELTTLENPGADAPLCRIVMSDISERKRAEQALLERQTALRAFQTRLGQLVDELSRVEEREQKRLAECLHDEIGQPLALMRMKLGALAASLGAGTVQEEIAQMRNLLEATLDQTRSLVFDLGLPVLHQLGLAAAVKWAGEKICREHNLVFATCDCDDPRQLDDERKVLLFRCVRELMMNTVKHARATRLMATVKDLGGRVRVTVEDDGCGFDMETLDRRMHEAGFGLLSVRERLATAGGQCVIASEPGGGTRVTLEVPNRRRSGRTAREAPPGKEGMP